MGLVLDFPIHSRDDRMQEAILMGHYLTSPLRHTDESRHLESRQCKVKNRPHHHVRMGMPTTCH
jgi:hypothetical protein